jgi:hypothetical protein
VTAPSGKLWQGTTNPSSASTLTYKLLTEAIEKIGYTSVGEYRPQVDIVSPDYYKAIETVAKEFDLRVDQVHGLMVTWAWSNGKWGSEKIFNRVCDLWFGEKK